MALAARLAATLFLTAAAVPSAAETLTFSGSCETGPRITIAAVGDLLFHDRLQIQAYERDGGFARFWAPVADILRGADITYGNLEQPVARGVSRDGAEVADPGRHYDGVVYDTYPAFNVHASVLDDLVAGGFDLVSTANNHAFDRGALGIDRTVEALDARGLAFTGTRARSETGRAWSVRIGAGGFTVAWLACAEFLNIPNDRDHQVLSCADDRDAVLGEVARLAADPAVDAVILTPHWGEENEPVPTPSQRGLGRDAIASGATAVIGTHPHTVQPWEKVEVGGREGLVVYSTGNFVSDQRHPMQRAGIIALVGLVKTGSGTTVISGAGHVPTWVEMENYTRPDSSDHLVTNNSDPVRAPDALREQLAILPAGNRVAGADLAALPGACSAHRDLPVPAPSQGGSGLTGEQTPESLR